MELTIAAPPPGSGSTSAALLTSYNEPLSCRHAPSAHALAHALAYALAQLRWSCSFKVVEVELQREVEWQQREAEWQQREAEWEQWEAEWEQREANWQQRKADWQQRKADWQQQKADWQQQKAELQLRARLAISTRRVSTLELAEYFMRKGCV